MLHNKSLNRPNRNGSLLSPAGWMALASCFWIIGLTIAAVGLGAERLRAFARILGRRFARLRQRSRAKGGVS
jgi:hypothetical protein